MKPNCVILSDVALRQKALDVLSSYNPAWLRLGLVIVLGTIALTEQEGEKQTDAAFLRVLVEEHFFFDSTLAKQFSTNRSVLAPFYVEPSREHLSMGREKRLRIIT